MLTPMSMSTTIMVSIKMYMSTHPNEYEHAIMVSIKMNMSTHSNEYEYIYNGEY